MFIGHYAPALIAATLPRAPGLGSLFIAAQLVDIGFFTLVTADIEHLRIAPGISTMNPFDLYHMPYTHSLLGSAVWAVGFAVILWLLTRNRMAAIIGGAVVLSHWFIDLIVHVPDLTLWGTPPRLGFGLWNQPAIAMPLELGITLAALLYYIWRTRASRSSGRLGVSLLAILLLTAQIVNWFGAEPAEADSALPLTALAAYGAIALVAWWVGRARYRAAER